MKKFLFIFSLFFSCLFIQTAQANSPSDYQEIKNRYSGSVVVCDEGFDKSYWYIVPIKAEKFPLENTVDLNSLLNLFAQGIHNKDLEKISSKEALTNIDYQLTHKFRGRFLLQTEEKGEAWYINPLDNQRYYISNNTQGLETLKNLAIDISRDKLEIFTLSEAKDSISVSKKEFEFFRYFEVFDLLKNRYYQPDLVNEKELFYGSLQGMAQSLGDPYTEFFTPSAKKDFDNSLEGTLEGIGVMIDTREGILEIISPLENSPAIKAGLKAKDQILTVDGIDIYGYHLEDSVNLIKGPAGTEVLLNIYRPSSRENFSLKITREKINLESISGQELENNIIYFKINRFDLNLKSEFENIKKELLKPNSRGVIIDLRNNPGGYSQAALDLADYWLPKNVTVVQEKYPDSLYLYNSRQEQKINLPTVILVNQGTASASEIFAAALSEHGVAKIIGQETFGKGTGQMLFNFPDQSALKFTIFEWLTPNGQSLEKNGLVPDLIIENQDDDFDKQLEKAIEILR
ncbi:MAG: S41 family peptidase [Patescibacteria group bacterium]|nr:S41 family peptidase [Patescibacteria group bacterium]